MNNIAETVISKSGNLDINIFIKQAYFDYR